MWEVTPEDAPRGLERKTGTRGRTTAANLHRSSLRTWGNVRHPNGSRRRPGLARGWMAACGHWFSCIPDLPGARVEGLRVQLRSSGSRMPSWARRHGRPGQRRSTSRASTAIIAPGSRTRLHRVTH